jgi:hypothetical protein
MRPSELKREGHLYSHNLRLGMESLGQSDAGNESGDGTHAGLQQVCHGGSSLARAFEIAFTRERAAGRQKVQCILEIILG